MINETYLNAKILVVDDKMANIVILESLLESYNYTNIQSTTDSRKVVEMFNTFQPDLILLDLMMPYFSGYEVMAQLKEYIPENSYLPILVLTADITNEAKQRALSEGAKDFLAKPFDLVEVGLRIKNLLFARYLYQQLQNQNQILDEKVKERTYELELTNLELIVSRDKAQSSDKLKTAFIQNISHEVRTPLNGILGFGTMLSDSDSSEEDRQEYISMLQISSNRLIKTITDYMDISLILSDNVEVSHKSINITQLVKSIKYKYNDRCMAKNLLLELEVPVLNEEIYIISDYEMVEKIFIHLLDNAVKFTSKGRITFGYTTSNEVINFFVKDTGNGIHSEARERIFEYFMQEDISSTRGHEGSGLGLSITKGFLNILGGEMHFESEKGEGSTFYFSLPIEANISKTSEPSLSQFEQNEQSDQPVILIVDDEYVNRIYLKTLLKRFSTHIFLANNGKEAVALCHKYPEISLVLMDIKMPVMNGFDATREIKLFRKNMPIIAITAHVVQGDEQKVLDAGFDDYLAKPTSKEDFLEKLKKYGITV